MPASRITSFPLNKQQQLGGVVRCILINTNIVNVGQAKKKKIMEKWQNGKKGIERAKSPRRNKDQTLQAIYKNRNDANWSWNRCMLHDSSSLFDIFVCSNICSWLGVNLMFDSFALFNCGRQFFAPATLFFWGTLKMHTIVFATCLHVQNKCMI